MYNLHFHNYCYNVTYPISTLKETSNQLKKLTNTNSLSCRTSMWKFSGIMEYDYKDHYFIFRESDNKK